MTVTRESLAMVAATHVTATLGDWLSEREAIHCGIEQDVDLKLVSQLVLCAAVDARGKEGVAAPRHTSFLQPSKAHLLRRLGNM
jgi:hypothetical protein